MRISMLNNPDYYIDLNAGTVVRDGIADAEIKSAIQFAVLSFFAENHGCWLSKEQIISNCWPDHPDFDTITDSTFNRTMFNLREIHPEIKASIEYRRGFGYRYNGSGPLDALPVQDSALSAGTGEPVSPAAERSTPTNEAFAASFSDLLAAGYTPLSIAEALVRNDMNLYASIFQKRKIAAQNEGTAIQWAEFLSSYPMSFQYLVNKEMEIVGNFSFVSITDEIYEDFLSEHLFEETLLPSLTCDLFSSGSDHIMFLLNLSVNDEYATVNNNTLLRGLFLQQLLSFAENDSIFFKKIITNVFKASQEAFYKQWGFRFIRQHSLSGNIYELDMAPYPDALYQQLKNNKKLADINERLKICYDQEYSLK